MPTAPLSEGRLFICEQRHSLRVSELQLCRSPLRTLSRFRKFGQRDKWKGCSLTAIKMAETRSNDDTTSTPESHSSL